MRKIIAIAALAAALVLAPVTAAHAHHNTITATVVCNTTTWNYDVTWSVENSEGLVETITSSSNPGLVPAGTTLAANEVATFVQAGVTPGTYDLTLAAKWSNNQTATNSGSIIVVADPGCVRPAPQPTGNVAFEDGDCLTTNNTFLAISNTRMVTIEWFLDGISQGGLISARGVDLGVSGGDVVVTISNSVGTLTFSHTFKPLVRPCPSSTPQPPQEELALSNGFLANQGWFYLSGVVILFIVGVYLLVLHRKAGDEAEQHPQYRRKRR